MTTTCNPPQCPICREPLAWHGCTGKKDGCSLEKTRAEKRQDPAYQEHSARLTLKRLELLAKPQQKINLTKDQLQRLSPTPAGDGWGVFHAPVSSWLHDMPEADLQTEQGWVEGIRQETEHHVQLSRKTKQAAIETQRAVQAFQQQLNISTLTSADLDREISRQCRQGPLRGADSWFRWLVLTKAPPWGFYPWSVELTKLVDPHTRRAVIVQANLSLRPGISKTAAKRAAEEVAKRWLDLKSQKGRPGLTDHEGDAIRTACKQVLARDGKPRYRQRNDFIKKVGAELKRMRFSLNRTTVGNRCREFFQENGMRIKPVTAAKRDPDRS